MISSLSLHVGLFTSALAVGMPLRLGALENAPTGSDVKLDLLVRDKKGIPVRDLRPEEVEIVEAGVKRTPSALALVESPAPPGDRGRPRYVGLVFDGLDAEGQKSARKAAVDFLTQAGAASDLSVGVFRIGLELWAVQGFTRDASLAKAAIERAAGTDDQALQQVSADAKTTAAREMGVPEMAPPARALIEVMRVADEMQKMRQDQSSMYPLLAVCKGLSELPGRKTVLYFSQGMYVPGRLDDVLTSLISEANRANVAVYAIDARGLRTAGDLQGVKSAMEDLNKAGLKEAQDTVNQQRGVGDFRLGERVGESVKQGERNSLQELAASTSGEFLAGANDLRKATDRILQDSASYYEIAYPPSSGTYDGLFRRVEVKVARPGMKVAHRSGYFALPPATRGATVLAYEIPMIAALEATPAPRDLPVLAGALRFGDAKEGSNVLLMVEVPLAGFKFPVDEKARVYQLRFALLAQVKGEDGAVVYKVSQVYPFEGPLDKLDALKRGNVIFKRNVVLGPGSYTLEGVVQDRGTNATAVARSGFSVPTGGELKTGSISVIRRVDELAPDKMTGTDPLRVENLRIVPNLDAPISKSGTRNLSLFLPVYPAAGGGGLSMTLVLSRDGAPVAQAPMDLPGPDPQGRVPAVATFPLDPLTPGTYGATITIKQGGATAVEKGSFVLVP